MDFYKSKEWLELRYKVLIRYSRKCMLCRSTTSTIHVDHIKPRSLFPELALDINNLQVLCAECNLGKSNKSADDLRPMRKKNLTYTLPPMKIGFISSLKTTHIWNHNDTACKVWASGGIGKKNRYVFSNIAPEGIKICKMCSGINNKKVAQY